MPATMTPPAPRGLPAEPDAPAGPGLLRRIASVPLRAGSALLGFFVWMVFLGFSLIPLTALLLFLPALVPQETVLSDTVGTTRNRFASLLRRAFAVVTGVTMLLALLAFGVQVTSWLNLKSDAFARMSVNVFGDDLSKKLPPAMVQGWPFVVLVVYATDLLLLFFIGKVPLQYNLRNLRVRWRTTLLTALAFVVVIALLTAMMAFVNGVQSLTSSSGIPGNVFVLSEGAPDEAFSNLYGSADATSNIRNWYADSDPRQNPKNPPRLVTPIRVRSEERPGLEPFAWCSREVYFTINQEVPSKNGQKSRRRFIQLRGIEDAEAAAKVHNIKLLDPDKDKWFGREGTLRLADGSFATPCVLGEGIAATLGDDQVPPKRRLDAGDVFMLNDLKMVVSGIMKSDGTTFGSEVWATQARVGQEFGKKGFTTVVLRVDGPDADPAEALERAEIFAAHLRNNFTTIRVNARSEPKYYEDLGKSNQQVSVLILAVAIIMAIGGIFGVMNTMFAAIAQRMKEIGVMRVLGFKRWQILVSFMLESLAIAFIGGLLGVMIGGLMDGRQMSSTISSGQGGGKSVVLRLAVTTDVVVLALLFAMVMGRLGGLVPSLNAMRKGILESLK